MALFFGKERVKLNMDGKPWIAHLITGRATPKPPGEVGDVASLLSSELLTLKSSDGQLLIPILTSENVFRTTNMCIIADKNNKILWYTPYTPVERLLLTADNEQLVDKNGSYLIFEE